MKTYLLNLAASTAWAVGAKPTFSLVNLPSHIDGKPAHVLGFLLDCDFSADLSSGNVTAEEILKFITNVRLSDGNSVERLNCSFKALRVYETVAAGRHVFAEPPTSADETKMWFRRLIPVGPLGMAGSVDNGGSDFAVPTGVLRGGTLQYTAAAALTDITANMTATNTVVNVRCFAILTILDDIIIPPNWVLKEQALSATEGDVVGRALYTHLILGNSSNWDAITAGDFANITLKFNGADTFTAVPVQAISALCELLRGNGSISNMYGEPGSSTDANQRTVDPATVTALKAALAIAQPLFAQPRLAKLTKCPVTDAAGLHYKWSGTQSTAQLLFARIEPQPKDVVQTLKTMAFSGIQKSAVDGRFKMLSKKAAKIPVEKAQFIPIKLKLK